MPMAYAAIEPAPEPRPGPTRMPLLLRPVDEVGDDEEVAGEAHLHDDADLVVAPARARRPGCRSGSARASPRSTSLMNQVSSVSPAGTGKRGM